VTAAPPGKLKFVFDFGGVVFRWQPARLLARVLPGRAVDAASAAHWVELFFQHYEGDWGEFDRGTLAADGLVQRIAARTGLAAAEVQRVVDAVPDELQPQADTLALMRDLLARGHELYYLSNMPAPFADHLLATHAFIGGFRDGVFSSRVQLCKPEAAIFELAARRFDARPAELVFLDDHAANVQAARALGWKALQFADAAQAQAELRGAGWMD
jgi:putative hydrolase of the HAD superfamily